MHKLHNARLLAVLFALLTLFVMAGQSFAAKDPEVIVTIENCNIVITYEDPNWDNTSLYVSTTSGVLASYPTGMSPMVPAWEWATVSLPITQNFPDETIFVYFYNSDYDHTYSLTIVPVPNSLVSPCLESQCAYPLPVDAVQGRLEGATQAYYAPSTDAKTEIVLPVGSSWWVAGSENGFYKLFVACQANYLWVPASALGANYDNPWNGAALPATGA
jgi:hypothetical protein